MKYMLLLYSTENTWTPGEWQSQIDTLMGVSQELVVKGQFITASLLHPVSTGVTVRVRDGRPLVTAGPFAKTAEQLGGYYMIDVESLDEAIVIATRLLSPEKGTVEIRPIRDTDNLPSAKFASELPDGMKKFIFLCYDDEQHWLGVGPEVHEAAIQQAVKITHRLDRQGQFVSAAPLHPSSTATSVRIRQGKRQITDGPFAETREVLGGYYLIFAHDQAEALTFAAEHPGVHVGAVEVRELLDLTSIVTATLESI